MDKLVAQALACAYLICKTPVLEVNRQLDLLPELEKQEVGGAIMKELRRREIKRESL